MAKMHYAFASEMTADEIKAVRKMLRMTQQDFSEFCNVSGKTVEHWESGKVKVTGPVVVLLRLLKEDEKIPARYYVPPQNVIRLHTFIVFSGFPAFNQAAFTSQFRCFHSVSFVSFAGHNVKTRIYRL